MILLEWDSTKIWWLESAEIIIKNSNQADKNRILNWTSSKDILGNKLTSLYVEILISAYNQYPIAWNTLTVWVNQKTLCVYY